MNNVIKINKFIVFSIVLLFGLIIAKLFFVSTNKTIDGIKIREFALSRTTEKKTIYASRGNIYDISGELLAENVNSYTVIAYLSETRTKDKKKPQHVVDIDLTANSISPIINMDVERLKKLLKSDAYQVELGPEGRDISELVKEKIEKLKLPGIDFIKTSKRYYPYGSFAPYILGYAKKNESGELIGEMGIESFYNDKLSGQNGYIEYQKDAYGYKIANTPVIETEALNGDNITLTIDSNIQMYLENAISDLSSKAESDWAIITVADAKTGAIMGFASNPTFDANKLDITNYNNPLVSYTYEPGSTMKIFSFMSSIEEGKYNGSDLYNSGTIKVDDYIIKDWNDYGWGKISYDTGFTYSSNVAATLLAQGLGKEKLLDYYNELGFGKKTGVELYGELAGKVNIMYNSELASASYGQGITITPIQMIQALTSITNNGTILKPYVVDKITNSYGDVTFKGKRKEINKVYSIKTVDKIKELMDLTVNGEDTKATGVMYKTDKVRLIGKTGTAQYTLDNGEYSSNIYNIRSFAGIFPKDKPEYIIYLAIKDLNGGSSLMGNMVKSVVESISKYKNLSNRDSNKDESKNVKLSNYLNKSINDVLNELNSLNLTPVIIGDGNIINYQYPSKNTNVVIGSKVYLKTNSNKKIMPNIIGFNKTEVKNIMKILDIDYEIIGTGKVVSVSIEPFNEIKEKVIINMEG